MTDDQDNKSSNNVNTSTTNINNNNSNTNTNNINIPIMSVPIIQQLLANLQQYPNSQIAQIIPLLNTSDFSQVFN